MTTTRIGPKHQITIPQQAVKMLGLKVGDSLEVQVKGTTIHLVPQRLVPVDQVWFWSKEWQQKEKEADEDIAHGRLSGPFTSADELVRHLRGR
jgi:AbrB family looped-hinge helix DNA binding protein